MGDGKGGMRGMPSVYGGNGRGEEADELPPPPRKLTSLEAIEAFIKEVPEEPSVIGYFPKSHETRGSTDYDAFMAVATSDDAWLYRFAFAASDELMEQ